MAHLATQLNRPLCLAKHLNCHRLLCTSAVFCPWVFGAGAAPPVFYHVAKLNRAQLRFPATALLGKTRRCCSGARLGTLRAQNDAGPLELFDAASAHDRL
eukprot:9117974-Lingulodinium_polyedra.AAC.1